ncbi:MAG: Conserved uncharacterized protein CreA, partial [uncultured Acetobacteraceae bacterium]
AARAYRPWFGLVFVLAGPRRRNQGGRARQHGADQPRPDPQPPGGGGAVRRSEGAGHLLLHQPGAHGRTFRHGGLGGGSGAVLPQLHGHRPGAGRPKRSSRRQRRAGVRERHQPVLQGNAGPPLHRRGAGRGGVPRLEHQAGGRVAAQRGGDRADSV